MAKPLSDAARARALVPNGSPEPMPGRCGAKLSGSLRRWGVWRYCKRAPLKGRARCYRCGGKSLAGVAHPQYRHGLYSKVLKELPLGAHYQAALVDPELTNLREQVALIQARIFELFEQMLAGAGPVAWARAKETAEACAVAMQAVKTAVNDRSPQRPMMLADALKQLDAAIGANVQTTRDGSKADETWPHITEQVYLHKKLVDSEVKRQKTAHEMLTREQALAFMRSIAESIHTHVTDQKQKQAIVDDMRRLMAGAPQA